MAWREIIHRCGHEDRKQFYGKYSDRDRAVAYQESRLCRECWLAEQKKANENKASELAKKIPLAKLRGSEKQVAWATGIRADVINALKKYQGDTSVSAEGKSAITRLVDALVINPSARFWIDNFADDRRSGYDITRNVFRKFRGKTPDEVISQAVAWAKGE